MIHTRQTTLNQQRTALRVSSAICAIGCLAIVVWPAYWPVAAWLLVDYLATVIGFGIIAYASLNEGRWNDGAGGPPRSGGTIDPDLLQRMREAVTPGKQGVRHLSRGVNAPICPAFMQERGDKNVTEVDHSPHLIDCFLCWPNPHRP